MKKLVLLLFIFSCTHQKSLCSEWIRNTESKYPAFIESKTIKVSNINDILLIADECEIINVVSINNEIFVITK